VKKLFPFILLLLLVSSVSGWLMSQASWLGRVGISLLHREYNLLKIWWQGGGVIFLLLAALLWLQSGFRLRMARTPYFLLQAFFILLALAGLYATKQDFSTDYSHRLLGWRFHFGVYLFWLGWICVSLYSIFYASFPSVTDSSSKPPSAV